MHDNEKYTRIAAIIVIIDDARPRRQRRPNLLTVKTGSSCTSLHFIQFSVWWAFFYTISWSLDFLFCLIFRFTFWYGTSCRFLIRFDPFVWPKLITQDTGFICLKLGIILFVQFRYGWMTVFFSLFSLQRNRNPETNLKLINLSWSSTVSCCPAAMFDKIPLSRQATRKKIAEFKLQSE